MVFSFFFHGVVLMVLQILQVSLLDHNDLLFYKLDLQMLQLQLLQVLKVAQRHKQKNQLDITHHYNTQDKTDVLQLLTMKH